MIKTDLLYFLNGLTDAELYEEYEQSLAHNVGAYSKVAEHLTMAMTNSVHTQVDIVRYEQELNGVLITFRDTMNYLLHVLLVMNQRIAKQRLEENNKV